MIHMFSFTRRFEEPMTNLTLSSPLMIYGKTGAGKTVCMADFIKNNNDDYPAFYIIGYELSQYVSNNKNVIGRGDSFPLSKFIMERVEDIMIDRMRTSRFQHRQNNAILTYPPVYLMIDDLSSEFRKMMKVDKHRIRSMSRFGNSVNVIIIGSTHSRVFLNSVASDLMPNMDMITVEDHDGQHIVIH